MKAQGSTQHLLVTQRWVTQWCQCYAHSWTMPRELQPCLPLRVKALEQEIGHDFNDTGEICKNLADSSQNSSSSEYIPCPCPWAAHTSQHRLFSPWISIVFSESLVWCMHASTLAVKCPLISSYRPLTGLSAKFIQFKVRKNFIYIHSFLFKVIPILIINSLSKFVF